MELDPDKGKSFAVLFLEWKDNIKKMVEDGSNQELLTRNKRLEELLIGYHITTRELRQELEMACEELPIGDKLREALTRRFVETKPVYDENAPEKPYRTFDCEGPGFYVQ